jgi:hypothetical protein
LAAAKGLCKDIGRTKEENFWLKHLDFFCREWGDTVENNLTAIFIK